MSLYAEVPLINVFGLSESEVSDYTLLYVLKKLIDFRPYMRIYSSILNIRSAEPSL